MQEQRICVECGFCCDGTLFRHAHLDKGERGGNLPHMIEASSFSRDDRDYFKLPCGYFSGKCTIYKRKRANVCGSYRCQLLKNMAADILSPGEALAIVEEARSIRSTLLEGFRNLSGRNEEFYFMQVLSEIGKYSEMPEKNETDGETYEILQAKCNIFEALLIKYFRPADDFDRMIMI